MIDKMRERIKELRKRWETRNWEPIPSYGHVFTWDEFVRDVRNRCLTDYDGNGHYAIKEMNRMDGSKSVYPSDITIFDGPRPPEYVTHVVWFNR